MCLERGTKIGPPHIEVARKEPIHDHKTPESRQCCETPVPGVRLAKP
jgi:hypothetical protein